MMRRWIVFLVLLCATNSAQALAQDPNTGAVPFFGATTGAGGVKGLVPAPAAADVLAGNMLGPGGSWGPLSPINTVMPTGNYSVLESDAQKILLVNCSSPCTVTMPHSTASTFPTNSWIEIVSIGSPTGIVTISAASTSTIYGVPLVGANAILSTYGDYVELQADASNNYLAVGRIATLSTPAFTGTANGLVPASGGGTTNFLRADAQWAVPPGSGGGGGLGANPVPAQPTFWSIDFQPGVLTALPATTVAGGATKIPISATIDNITLSTLSYTCSVAPTVSLRRCGTSLTCAASTDRGSASPSSTPGTFVNVSPTDQAVPAGDYLAWEFTAGTCSALDIQATAMLHSNPGACPTTAQLVFTTYCNSAFMSLI